MKMMYLYKFFERERNMLINFYGKKKGKVADKVNNKSHLIKDDQINLILKCYLIYKKRENLD